MIPDKEPVNTWDGNSSNITFDFDFLINSEKELLVLHTDKTGIQNTLKLNIDYTIHQTGNADGSYITFPILGSSYKTLGEGEKITLMLNIPIAQTSPYGTSDKLNLRSLEFSLDYIVRLIQMVNRKVERSVKVQEGSSTTPDDLIESLNQAQMNAQNFATIASNKANEANNSAIKAENQATIATAKTLEVQQIYENAMSDISENHTNAVVDIQNQLSIAEDTIIADKTDALENISAAKTNAVDACENEVEKAKRYAEQSGGKGMPTDICRRLNIEYDTENRKVKLRWKDPSDTVNSYAQVMASWAGTIITCKENDYPADYDDGTQIVTNTVRNKYLNKEFEYIVPEGIEDITTLKFRAFPYSVNGVYNKDNRNCFDKAIVYEMLLCKSGANSNPKAIVTYPEGSVNEYFTPAYMDFSSGVFNYGSWKDAFFMDLFRPCMLKSDGTVDYYLCPDDLSLREDGITVSDISNTNYDGNAMVEIGQIWIKCKNENGKKHVWISNKKVDEDYKCWTHYNKNGKLLKYIYRSIYDGALVNNKVRSIAGLQPCKNLSGETQMAYAKANGEGWNIDKASIWMLINWLLLLIGRSTDTQSVFGTGRHTGGSQQNNNQLNSGDGNQKGMFYGDNANGIVKVFHIENWWGNIWKIINGIILKDSKLHVKMTPNTQDGTTAIDYNTTAEGYIDTGITLSGTSGGYIREMALVEDMIMLPKVVSGSSTTYFPDGCWWNNGIVGFARFGCSSGDGLLGGAFPLDVNGVLSHSTWSFGVSLSYKSPL